MAIASPRTSCAVVEEVGARLCGQASSAISRYRITPPDFFAACARREVWFDVIAMIGTFVFSREDNSSDSPLLEIMSRISSLEIKPTSPCAASDGCRNFDCNIRSVKFTACFLIIFQKRFGVFRISKIIYALEEGCRMRNEVCITDMFCAKQLIVKSSNGDKLIKSRTYMMEP